MSEVFDQVRSSVTIILIVVLLVVYLVNGRRTSRRRRPLAPAGVPWVGKDSSRFWSHRKASLLSITRMQEWMATGYQKYSKAGRSYLLPDFSGKPILIVPPSQLKWLTEQPDHVLSTAAFHYDAQQGDFAFSHPRVLGDPYHEHVLHKSLPRKVGALVADIGDELAHTFDHIWGTDTESWKEVDVHESIDRLVAPTVNRMLVGLPLCRDATYLSEMHKFTMNAVTIMTVLQFTPSFLAPLVGRLLALPVAARLRNTSAYTLPIINERLANFQRKSTDPAFQQRWQEPNDYLSWHIALAMAENRPDELEPGMIGRRLMALNFAALHTTALGSINCLLDLVASDPAHGYLAGIREEVTRVLAEQEDGTWTKAGLNRCHRADSALRESLRVSNFMSRNVQKKVLLEGGVVNEQEGWCAPRGSYVAVDMHGPQHDEDIYPCPETYDAFRFSRSREVEIAAAARRNNGSNKWIEGGRDGSGGGGVGDGGPFPPAPPSRSNNTSTLTTGPTFLPFGHGRHACPGRFFIAVEVKLMLAYMTMRYEIEPLETRPVNRWLGGIRLPPGKAAVRVKRRKEGGDGE